jgi:hypothetical protein
MARYSRADLEFILDNYWILRTGVVPADGEMIKTGHNNHAPYEMALIWVSDVDSSIDKLDELHPGRWLKVAPEVTQQRLEQIVHRFNARQQLIMRMYLVPDKYQYTDKKSIWRAIKRLQRYMSGVK